MSIERIKQKIFDETDVRRQAIRQQYEQKIAELKKQTEEEIAKIHQTFVAKSQSETKSILERATTEAELEQKKQILTTKWEIINNIFEQVAQKFPQLPEYIDILKRVIEANTSDKNSEVIITPADRAKLKPQFPNIKFIESSTIKGGVIIKSGKTELNFSLDANLRLLKDELIIELAKILFRPESL
jgi:V/A-type H+-transporting ATPase subunit E